MRYQVVKGSESGHCCFEATVVDTHKKCSGGHHDDWVCECFNLSQAHQIADALNTVERLPLSEDGVRIAPDDTVWQIDPKG